MPDGSLRRLSAALVLTMCMCSGALAQTAGKTYTFLLHASFFSLESRQPNLLDPHVFVADAAAPGGVGPQGIEHVAGVRPAFGVEDGGTPLLTAQGNPLGFTAAQWFAASGSVTLTPGGGSTTVTYKLANLIPAGVYSFFENHFSPSGVTFTPLDGAGSSNTFTCKSDGTASGSFVAPGEITHSEGVLLVYHSDRTAHGTERGKLGVVAHHQLIVRIP